MSTSLGSIYFNYTYQYKNGKFGTIRKTRTIYTSPTSNKKKGSIKKEQKYNQQKFI
jgi:hypothetical protein